MATDLLIEIGLEELPARFVDSAAKQLKENAENWLKEKRISFRTATSFSTPRRLAVVVSGVAEKQATLEEEAKGPTEKIAKDADGNWTKAAIGFMKGQDKTTEDIYVKEVKGTSYIFAKKRIEGKQTIDILPEIKTIIPSIQFAKNMRWGKNELRYARPIRWLVALYGETVIPFEIAQVKTGNTTYGHRFLGNKIVIPNPVEYERLLKENYVIANQEEREQKIVEDIQKLEKEKGIHIPIDKDLLEEVKNLVEYPTVFMGAFESAFLKLPPQVLITSMKEHQRYFSVKADSGKLLPNFVGVRNGDNHDLETVIKGNEKVLAARLADAQFFYEEDQKHAIDFYMDKLKTVVFQEKLGTVHDKVERVVQLTTKIAELANLATLDTHHATRAAEICKFDLATNMVNEFTELQGIMGKTYALKFGENEHVAQAIEEHYLPRYKDDALPESNMSAIVSIADKLDTIVGCISAGLVPTGSQDPYALRRQATGILRILRDKNWTIPLETLLDSAKSIYEKLGIAPVYGKEIRSELHNFFQMRAIYLLKESGIEQDVIQAVLHNEIGIVPLQIEKANALSEKRKDAAFKHAEEALVRVMNLVGKADKNGKIDPHLLETDTEKDLYKKYQEVAAAYKKANDNLDAKLELQLLGSMADEIHAFFEHNMIMAEDTQVRNNRLALIHDIAGLVSDFADLSKIEWKQKF